jgi:mannosyl-oligosaccharide alpha-1,2-mannosidase
MLGGQAKQYRTMYEDFIEVAKEHIIFRPMTVSDKDILLSGELKVGSDGNAQLTPNMQHLTCFTGGMLAIAGKIFDRPQDVADGKQLTDGCIWAYQNTPSGIMPETFTAVPCANKTSCPWDEQRWFQAVDPLGNATTAQLTINSDRLPPGFARAHDRRYLLRFVPPLSPRSIPPLTAPRPEAIESVFVLWRVTGDQHWPDSGWDMFMAIQASTTTALAHSAIDDVLSSAPNKTDEMESFWTAETLKYFYLLFSETDIVSLDNYVL